MKVLVMVRQFEGWAGAGSDRSAERSGCRDDTHLNVTNIEVQTKFWSEYLGAVPLKEKGCVRQGA
jgi:hypothetical protein